jgi:hypothetical protein
MERSQRCSLKRFERCRRAVCDTAAVDDRVMRAGPRGRDEPGGGARARAHRALRRERQPHRVADGPAHVRRPRRCIRGAPCRCCCACHSRQQLSKVPRKEQSTQRWCQRQSPKLSLTISSHVVSLRLSCTRQMLHLLDLAHELYCGSCSRAACRAVPTTRCHTQRRCFSMCCHLDK